MKIAIIVVGNSQTADTVRMSIECFALYGNHDYEVIPLINGELSKKLNNFEALIVHYSTIAFPLRHYLPISLSSTLQISSFRGLKFAFVQDEQRAAKERLLFLNNLGIHHLFSVAPVSLFDILYPSSKRNFSVSNVLTGYVSKIHLAQSQSIQPLIHRAVDVSYRGRSLPNWMGKTATIKGEIPTLIQNLSGIGAFRADLSSKETKRIYGNKWFDFLKESRVSIATPSGSDFLDIDGMYQEDWVPQNKKINTAMPPVAASYQVVSPRVFDYIAAGNLVAATPGNYSGVLKPGTFVELADDLSNLPDILKFSTSEHAQKIVNNAQKLVLNEHSYHYMHLVQTFESHVDNLNSKSNQVCFERTHPPIHLKNKFKNDSHVVLFRKLILQIVPGEIKKKLKVMKSNHLRRLVVNKAFINKEVQMIFKELPLNKLQVFFYRFSLQMKSELYAVSMLRYFDLNSISTVPISSNSCRIIITHPDIEYQPDNIYNTPTSDINSWNIDLSAYGVCQVSSRLTLLPRILDYNADRFMEILNYTNRKDCEDESLGLQ